MIVDQLTTRTVSLALAGIEADGGDKPAEWYVGICQPHHLRRWREVWWDRLVFASTAEDRLLCQRRIDLLGEALGLIEWWRMARICEANQAKARAAHKEAVEQKALGRWSASLHAPVTQYATNTTVTPDEGIISGTRTVRVSEPSAPDLEA